MKKVKIAFTGPESSGKTTMSLWLSGHLSCEMVPEYAREYLSVNMDYQIEDLNAIAKEQYLRNSASKKLIIDTEMLVMKIWCEEKYTICSKDILALYKEQKIDHYFLCSPDIPWESDTLRENPNDRERLFEVYERNLLEIGASFNILSGSVEVRKVLIINTLKNLGIL